jgi:sugar phosphate isomerase/epimerase
LNPVRVGVCATVLRMGSFEADLAAAAAAGVHAIGVSGGDLERAGIEHARRLMRDAGVVASSHMTGGAILDTAPPLDTDQDVALAIEQAALVEAPGVLVRTGPVGDLSMADADCRCIEWFETWGPVAVDHGVRLMLEPIFPLLRSFSYVHTLHHALRLVADTEGAGVCVDLGHLWWDPDLLRDVRANIDRVVTVQVTDVETAALTDFRYEREQLGRGDVALEHLLGEIEAAGYRGRYEIEILVRIPRGERVALVRDARRFLESFDIDAALGTKET